MSVSTGQMHMFCSMLCSKGLIQSSFTDLKWLELDRRD